MGPCSLEVYCYLRPCSPISGMLMVNCTGQAWCHMSSVVVYVLYKVYHCVHCLVLVHLYIENFIFGPILGYFSRQLRFFDAEVSSAD